MLGWAWDKLFEHDFVKKEKLLFQEIKIHNDLYFVYSALVSAERIAVLDEVLVHQRKRISGSLSNTDTKSTALGNVLDALLLTHSRLKLTGLDKIYERDFKNYALSLFFHHLDTSSGDVREELYNLIQGQWLNQLSFDSHDADYFYLKNEYIRYQYIKYLPYDYFLLVDELNNKVKKHEKVLQNTRKALNKARSEIKRLKKREASIRKSFSFRCGRFFTILPRMLKKLIAHILK
jgi:hypothetical protein